MRLTLVPLIATTLSSELIRASAPNTALTERDSVKWIYAGCFSDSIDYRSLSQDFYFSSDSMTVSSCADYCLSRGYTMIGLEYSTQCWCDQFVQPSALLVNNTECNMQCSGDKAIVCGGPNRLSTYVTDGPGPSTNQGVNGLSFVGCYPDSLEQRTLANPVYVEGGPDAMTVSACTASCYSKGFSMAGVEYGGECWCDVELQIGPSHVPAGSDVSGCNMVCRGNFSEYCGGSFRLNVYQWRTATSSMAKEVPIATPRSSEIIQVTSNPTPSDPAVAKPTSTHASTASASSSTSSKKLLTSPPPQKELLSNNNFTTTDAWTVTTNPSVPNSDALSGQYLATENGTAYSITTAPTKYLGSRSLCISQDFSIPRKGTYLFNAAIGRLVLPSEAPTDNNDDDNNDSTSLDQLYFQVLLDKAIIWHGSVCHTCPNAGVGGGYAAVSGMYMAAASDIGARVLSVCGVWVTNFGGGAAKNGLLVDDVSFWGAKASG